jgi:hypothetical protein
MRHHLLESVRADQAGRFVPQAQLGQQMCDWHGSQQAGVNPAITL